MRNKASVVVSAIALTACVCSVAYAVSLPSGLEARYNALIASLKKRELKTYDTFYAPEYVSVDPSGKSSTRAEYMTGIQDLMKGAKKFTCKVKYTGVKTHDSIVDVSFDFSGQVVKPEGTTTFHEVGTDSWKKTGKVWMEIKTVDKLFDVTAPKPAAK